MSAANSLSSSIGNGTGTFPSKRAKYLFRIYNVLLFLQQVIRKNKNLNIIFTSNLDWAPMKQLITFSILALLAVSTLAAEDGKVYSTAIANRPSDGRKIVYRFIQEYSPTFDRSKYPVRVTVSWRYSSPTGMPSVPERESMDKLEDLLVPQVRPSLASLALVRTGNNLRQWTFYTSSEAEFRKKLEQALKKNSQQPVEVESELEPGWETYEQFVQSVRK